MSSCTFCDAPLSIEEIAQVKELFPDLNPELPAHLICAFQTLVTCASCGREMWYYNSKYSEVYPIEMVCASCAERNVI